MLRVFDKKKLFILPFILFIALLWFTFYLYHFFEKNPLTLISLYGLYNILTNISLLILVTAVALSFGNLLFVLIENFFDPGINATYGGKEHTSCFTFSPLKRIIIQYGIGWTFIVLFIYLIGILGLVGRSFIRYFIFSTSVLPIFFFPVREVRQLVSDVKEGVSQPLRNPFILALTFALIPVLIHSFAPPTAIDELFYHLSIPSLFLKEGKVFATVDIPMTAFPLNAEMIFLLCLGLSNDTLPRLMNLSFSMFVLLALFSILKERGARSSILLLSLLLLFGTEEYLKQSGLAYSDIMTSFYLLLSFIMMDDRLVRPDGNYDRLRIFLFSIFSGSAIGFKYTSFYLLVPFYLCLFYWLYPKRDGCARRFPTIIYILLFTAIPLLPLMIKNLIYLENPLFPFLDYRLPDDVKAAFPFIFLQKYGMGRGFLSFLLLPFNMSVFGREGTYFFQGRLNPLITLLLPFSLSLLMTRSSRHIFFISMIGCLLWSFGPHSIRYLLPLLPFIIVTVTSPLPMLERVLSPFLERVILTTLLVFATLFFLGTVTNLYRGTGESLKIMFHPEERTEFLRDNLKGYPVIDYINRFTDEKSHIAFFFEGSSYYLERRYSFPSIEDHTPTRKLLYTIETPEGLLDALIERGVTHILMREPVFTRKSYPFLSEKEWREGFEKPYALFDRFRDFFLNLEFSDGYLYLYRLENRGFDGGEFKKQGLHEGANDPKL